MMMLSKTNLAKTIRYKMLKFTPSHSHIHNQRL